MDRVALPFCQTTLTAKKPLERAYPKELVTIGDHIRKRRLDLKLLQKEVAAKLGVDTTTVTNWEKARSGPTLRFIPRICLFLGYNPLGCMPAETSLGEQVRAYRKAQGISQKQLASDLGIDPTTLAHWERRETKPSTRLLERLTGLFSSGGLQANRESDGNSEGPLSKPFNRD